MTRAAKANKPEQPATPTYEHCGHSSILEIVEDGLIKLLSQLDQERLKTILYVLKPKQHLLVKLFSQLDRDQLKAILSILTSEQQVLFFEYAEMLTKEIRHDPSCQSK